MLCNHELLIYFSYMVYSTIKNNHMTDQELNKDHILPVQMVSADQYIYGLQVGSTTKRGNRIYLICTQKDVS